MYFTIMIKIICFFFLSALTTAFAGKQIPVTEKNVYDRSELWPFNVSIVDEEGTQTSGGGFPGILLRIEEDGTALVDFGRDGRKRIPVENTDIVENANKILKRQLVKDDFNFVRQTINMFATRKIGQKNMKPIDPKTFAKCANILLVYCDESIFTDECWESYQALLNDFVCTISLIIPTKITFYKGLAEHSEWDNVHVMLPHLSIAHQEQFEHYPILESGGLTFVLIDREGKVYEKWECQNPKDHKKTLKEVVRVLKRDYENCLLYK